MLEIYLETMITILAIYCVLFNLLRLFIKDLESKYNIQLIKKVYFSFWIIPVYGKLKIEQMEV